MLKHTLTTYWSSLGNPGQPLRKTKGGSQEAARSGIESRCRQIVILYPHLGYILNREGIKPQPKRVQAILALNPPHNEKELRHFLGMVQFYHDMWAKRSEMLAQLSKIESAEKRNQMNKVTLALGFNPSNSIWQCKIYHRVRGSADLSMLFKALWDIHRCFHFTVRSSNHSGE